MNRTTISSLNSQLKTRIRKLHHTKSLIIDLGQMNVAVWVRLHLDVRSREQNYIYSIFNFTYRNR